MIHVRFLLTSSSPPVPPSKEDPLAEDGAAEHEEQEHDEQEGEPQKCRRQAGGGLRAAQHREHREDRDDRVRDRWREELEEPDEQEQAGEQKAGEQPPAEEDTTSVCIITATVFEGSLCRHRLWLVSFSTALRWSRLRLRL